jgi:hypothetical protein
MHRDEEETIMERHEASSSSPFDIREPGQGMDTDLTFQAADIGLETCQSEGGACDPTDDNQAGSLPMDPDHPGKGKGNKHDTLPGQGNGLHRAPLL